MKKLIVVTMLAGLLFIRQLAVYADPVNKITWCHTEPNGNQETLELPQQALEQAGHVNAAGNPLHAGDHPGSCIEPTSSISPSPTQPPLLISPSSPTPTDSIPSPSPVIPSPSIAPTGIQPTSIPPTGTPSNSSSPANPDQVSAMGPGSPNLGIKK